MGRYGYPYPPWPLVPPPLPQFTASAQPPLQASTSSFPTVIPSSDSVTEDNQPIYPTISAWFEELDYGTGCGSTGYGFSSFVEAFDKVGIKSLHHLFDPHLFPNGLTLEALRGYVESLSPGAAAALIKYARRDKRKYTGNVHSLASLSAEHARYLLKCIYYMQYILYLIMMLCAKFEPNWLRNAPAVQLSFIASRHSLADCFLGQFRIVFCIPKNIYKFI